MDNAPESSNPSAAPVKPLQNTFLFDLEGHSVVAAKVASKVAKQISGQDMTSSRGIISKLKAKLGLTKETERWFVVTSVDNPLLEETDKFGLLVAERLTKATGATVSESDLTMSASVRVSGNREKDEPSAVRDDREELVTQAITTQTSLELGRFLKTDLQVLAQSQLMPSRIPYDFAHVPNSHDVPKFFA